MAAAHIAAYRLLLAHATATARMELPLAPTTVPELLPAAWEQVARECDFPALNSAG
jgi:hypothetical protein